MFNGFVVTNVSAKMSISTNLTLSAAVRLQWRINNKRRLKSATAKGFKLCGINYQPFFTFAAITPTCEGKTGVANTPFSNYLLHD